jgi:hypothetical protein
MIERPRWTWIRDSVRSGSCRIADEAARSRSGIHARARDRKEDDARVLALLSRVRSLEDEIHRVVKRHKADQSGAQ